jgi:K+-transporting ATPase KdpF subunit
MNTLVVLYGFGGMCAIALMVYLIYALLYAEEF